MAFLIHQESKFAFVWNDPADDADPAFKGSFRGLNVKANTALTRVAHTDLCKSEMSQMF